MESVAIRRLDMATNNNWTHLLDNIFTFFTMDNVAIRRLEMVTNNICTHLV